MIDKGEIMTDNYKYYAKGFLDALGYGVLIKKSFFIDKIKEALYQISMADRIIEWDPEYEYSKEGCWVAHMPFQWINGIAELGFIEHVKDPNDLENEGDVIVVQDSDGGKIGPWVRRIDKILYFSKGKKPVE